MAFATIDVTKGITGTIPVANGGTGLTSGTTNQFLKFTGSTTLASAADNEGKILQVVGGTFTTDTSTSSESFTDSNFNVSITPSATSSKLLINFSIANAYVNSGNKDMLLSLYSEIGGASANNIINFAQIRNDVSTGGGGMSYLYSPNTTSAVVLSIYFRRSTGGSGTVYFHNSNNNATDSMTVMEIGA
tara:strand:- start:251 stop:817 length:567 start_codon:yes stop_codon:yes gene_type:complete